MTHHATEPKHDLEWFRFAANRFAVLFVSRRKHNDGLRYGCDNLSDESLLGSCYSRTLALLTEQCGGIRRVPFPENGPKAWFPRLPKASFGQVESPALWVPDDVLKKVLLEVQEYTDTKLAPGANPWAYLQQFKRWAKYASREAEKRLLVGAGLKDTPTDIGLFSGWLYSKAQEDLIEPVVHRHTQQIEAQRIEEKPTDAGDNVFHKDGEYWTVTFGGNTVRLKDAKGLQYIAYLLARPETSIGVLDLVGAVGAGARDEPHVRQSPLDDYVEKAGPIQKGTQVDDITDSHALQAYWTRVQDIDRESEEAKEMGDEGRLERLADERVALVAEIASMHGLGGRLRHFAFGAQKAANAVSQAVRRSRKKLGKCLPELERHLCSSLQMGFSCIYAPEHQTAWHI